jgi:hypothetical protein
MSITYIDGDAIFIERSLLGSGVLYVRGNLILGNVLGAVRNHSFNGVIYVGGDFEFRANGSGALYGAVVAQGKMTMKNDCLWSGQPIVIQYDQSIIDLVRQQVSQYRENRGTFFAQSGLK